MTEKPEVRSPAAVIVFTLITCGIYGLVWIFKFSKEIKNYLNKEEINPGLELEIPGVDDKGKAVKSTTYKAG